MEDSKIQSLLEESVQLGRENAVEIKKIRKRMMWMGILRLVVWLIVAGVPVFLYLNILKPSFQDLFGF